MTDAAVRRLDAVLADLWPSVPEGPLASLLPRSVADLPGFYPRLRAFVEWVRGDCLHAVEEGAIVAGTVVASGEGSRIEAGAVIHRTCRLVLGARSVVRSGAVLRDEVVLGDDCVIGAHCEVVRSVVLGPSTSIAHIDFVADSIVGAGVMVAGHVMFANTPLDKSRTIGIRVDGQRVDSGRGYLGALLGDGVRIGASSTLMPGTVVERGLHLAPGTSWSGLVDAPKAAAAMRKFLQQLP